MNSLSVFQNGPAMQPYSFAWLDPIIRVGALQAINALREYRVWTRYAPLYIISGLSQPVSKCASMPAWGFRNELIGLFRNGVLLRSLAIIRRSPCFIKTHLS